MIKITQTLDFLEFDQVKFTKTLDRTLGQIIREAAREWLREMLSLGIPVETGMAKATLVPLGRFLNNVGGLQINPTRKPYYSKLEGSIQSVENGMSEGAQDFHIRDDHSDPLSFVYEFEWSTTILHYWLAEFYNGKAIVGEGAVKIAEYKMRKYIASSVKKRLPTLAKYIRKRSSFDRSL